MKVAVITRHAVTNYGSLLQVVATQQVIEDMGHTCEIIDYIREDEHYSQLDKTMLAQKPSWNNNPIKRTLYLALRKPESVKAGRKFEEERKKYLHLTKRYINSEQLLSDKPAADVYMTGSDQVWGPIGSDLYDDSFFLTFTEDNDKRVSYAASFGRTEMSAETKKHFSDCLGRYNHISVRENSAVEILSQMGMRVSQVLDPTLLLDSSYWSCMATPIRTKQKYVLVYQIHNDKCVGAYADKVAKAKGLPLIRISPAFHQAIREGKFVWCPKVGEFLSYIKNAECLITDSFHGTAFAINFNTPFVEVLPNNKTGTRNISILTLTGLTDRILTDDNDLNLAERRIDFSYANTMIEEERRKSLYLLKMMIER